MKNPFQSLLLLLATATDRALARQVHYLTIENRILRKKLPKRIAVTAQERRRLLKFGKPLGAAIRRLITIVSPRTFARWLSGEGRIVKATSQASRGRPPTKEHVRELVVRLARETGWGYTRILGELKKLGETKISRSTVVNILREQGLEPGPKRGEGTWDEFIRRHAATLWACDFFSKKVWTARGLIDVFVLFFLHVGSRRVHVAGLTVQPDRAWVTQQARNVAMVFAEEPEAPRYLLLDRDKKFTREFEQILEAGGVEMKRLGLRAPNLNAYAERWVQSVRRECLDHFIVLGEEHLRHLVTEYVDYYNRRRPHQALRNWPLTGAPSIISSGSLTAETVVCEERLGGLLRHYEHPAA